MPTDNRWTTWGKHVLSELERNNNDHVAMFRRLGEIDRSIVELKLKAGIWGLLGGMIPVVLGLMLFLLKGYL